MRDIAPHDLIREIANDLATWPPASRPLAGDELRVIATEVEKREAARADRPTIVCLCGSGRFKEAFDRAEFEETLAGKIVLTIGCNTHDVARTADLAKHKPALDELHLRKIDLADEVLILNVGGYVGESTGRELRYATEQRKSVRFLEPVDADRFADLLRRR